MGRFGIMEIAIIVGIALLLFGAGRIADIGKGLGEGIRNFKKGIKDEDPPKDPPQDPPKLPKKDESSADEEDKSA